MGTPPEVFLVKEIVLINRILKLLIDVLLEEILSLLLRKSLLNGFQEIRDLLLIIQFHRDVREDQREQHASGNAFSHRK